MANLNLSQFGENTSVSDADYTFVWDSAASISKKVSRNSWLNSGTLTSDAPVTISQTWNNAAVAFTGLKVNAVSTASASGSLLLDLQVGTISQFNVRKNGQALFSSGIVSAPGITFLSGSNTGIWETSAGVQFSSAGTNAFGIRNEIRVNGSLAFGFASGTPADTGLDVALWRDSPTGNTLALRNGAAAQTFNVYGTYTSGSVYERMFMRYNGTDLAFQIGTETAGATLRPLDFVIGGTRRLMIGTTGNVGIGTNGAPVSTLELRKDAAINGPMMIIRSNVRVAGNWASISFGDDTQASAYRKGALIYESTSSSANGKFHIALNNDGTTADATLADARLTVLPSGNVGIGTTAPTSKLHVAGSSSPSITVDNTLATGASQLLFKNTVVTGDTDGIFLNGSTQTGFGGAGSLNIKATTGPIAFHTTSVTNVLSIAQNGATTFASQVNAGSFVGGGLSIAFNQLSRNSGSVISFPSNGTIQFTNNAGTDFNLLQLGGTTASFPAIKRSTVRIQAVLANDSGFTNIQGKLTTDTDYTATVVTPTGFLTLYDAQGTAYRVPCVLAP